MRAFLPGYELKPARTLDEALGLLARGPGEWTPFAGGTDLMVLFEAGELPRGKYVSIWGLDELRGSREDGDRVSVGALTTYAEIRENPVMRERYPRLVEAAAVTGAVAIQNRGTLGGNIANASPAADSPPALLAYGAEVELVSAKGARTIPYDEFHTGYKQMKRNPDELVRAVHLPAQPEGLTHYYRKVGTRRAQAISKICLAAVGRVNGGRVESVRIGMGSVAPVPLRCLVTETLLNGAVLSPELTEKARDVIVSEITPIDDIRSDALYRSRVTGNLMAEFLERLGASGG